MSKSNKEVVQNIKENTIAMYDHTIEEMIKRGATKEEIDIVEKAKADAIAAYDVVPEEEEKACERKFCAAELGKNAINGMYGLVPILSNMFVVKMDNLPIYLFQSLYIDVNKKTVMVRMYETKEFSPYKHFSSHKKFDGMVIEHLNPQGVVERRDEIKGLKVSEISIEPLTYSSEEAWTSHITFKYKEYVPSAD